MSGWLLVSEPGLVAAPLHERLRRRLDVRGTELRSEVICDRDGLAVIRWQWGEDPRWMDFGWCRDDYGNAVLLDGYVSGLGKFAASGPVDEAGLPALLLRLWRKHGDEFVAELNGSFALALVDGVGRSVSLVTDRVGSRPVWQAHAGARLCAGNLNGAVAAVLDTPLTIDRAALWSLVASHRPVGERSIHRELRRIGAGKIVSNQAGRVLSERRWFELHYQPAEGVSVRGWGRRIAERLRASAAAISAHGDPALFLSGGLDSRIAAGAFPPGIQTITLITHPNRSSRIAEQVAASVGAEQETVIRDDSWYLDQFEAAAIVAGGNYNLFHGHYFQALHRIPQRERPVYLLGDLLENFNKHYYKLSDAEVAAQDLAGLPDIYSGLDGYAHKNWPRLQGLFNRDAAADMEAEWRAELTAHIARCEQMSADKRDVLDAMFRWSDNMYCPTNMMLECLKPFGGNANLMFDNELLDLLLSLPAGVKSQGDLHRAVMRSLNAKLLWIPNANFWLPPAAPAWLEELNRNLRRRARPLVNRLRARQQADGAQVSTQGSWHLMHEWYRNDPQHRESMQSLLQDTDALPGELFDHRAISASVEDFLAGDNDRLYELNALMSFAGLQRLIPASA